MNNLVHNLKLIFKNNIKIVGSIIRKKKNPSDIDMISLLPIDDFLTKLNKYYEFKIIKKGERITFIKIDNLPDLNIWYVKKDELPYSIFWLSYPQLFVQRVRAAFKKNNLKLNQYGLFEGKKQILKKEIKKNEDFFDLLKVLGYNYNYRSPAQEQKKLDLKGGDLYQNLANAYRSKFCNGKSRPLLPGEKHPFCANFLGPGTQIRNPEVRNYPPFSCSDRIARTHDLEYLAAWDLPKEIKSKKIREADEKFLKNIEFCKGDYPYYEIGKYGIGAKVGLENNTNLNLLPEEYRGSCLDCDN